jgi:hypothetical protein
MEQFSTVHFEDGNIKVVGELADGKYFLHCSVKRYGASIQKKLDLIFEQMKEAAREAGFPKEMFAVLKNEKYAYYMGGTKIKTIVSPDGEEMGVFKWVIL